MVFGKFSDNFANVMAGGNGAGLHAVPVNLPLSTALDRVAAAEKALEAARSVAKAAARQARVSIVGLFETSKFIRRETGERWSDEQAARSRAEGKQEAYRELTRIFCDMNGVDCDEALARVKVSAKIIKEESERWHAKMEKLGFFAAIDDENFELAGKIYWEAHPEQQRTKSGVARAILSAARRRDSDPSAERPKPEGLARAVVNAGRRRRGEKEI